MPDNAPTILVIEDDEDVRDSIREMLTEANFRVETAVTAMEALVMIEEQRFDLLVADIRLPGGVNGLEMARDARVRHPALKCLFISGQGEPVVCDPRLDDFVAKPFRPAELVGCVWKVLQGNLPNPRFEIFR
jgi:DNA-binding response OmpR family regulator